MQKKLTPLLCSLIFFAFLLYPSLVISGASEGVLLWFYTVLPNLFPFFVITNLLISTGGFQVISHIFAPLCSKCFKVSADGVIVILGGFLCGYPMGAKMVADLFQRARISEQEGNYLLSFCNNASPMFIVGFFVTQKLKIPSLALPSLLILFLSPIFCSFVFRKHYIKGQQKMGRLRCEKKVQLSSVGFWEYFDLAIWNGMETILKIGGYIIFFSILAKLCNHLPLSGNLWRHILVPSLEITNGLSLLEDADLLFEQKYILMMAQLSFGGFCAMFQTRCVLKEFDFSMCLYIIEKLVTATVTSLLSCLYLIIFTKFSL